MSQGWSLLCCDPPVQPSSRKEDQHWGIYEEDPTLGSNFLCCVWAAPFPPGKAEELIDRSFLFHSVEQSQTVPGTYWSRYFYTTRVFAQTLVLRQLHLTLKMSFKQWTELCSPSARWCLGGFMVWTWGSWQCFTLIQIAACKFLLLCLLDGKNYVRVPPAVQGRLRHSCPAKLNKMLTCTEVMGLNQFSDLPAPLDFLSSHTIRFYLRVCQGGVFFVLLKVLNFWVNE